jgi:hypothetical protein
MTQNSELIGQLVQLAEEHAQRLADDIRLARARDEHIRVTARANEARHIVSLINGLLVSNSDT